jgi:hypothetical protein
MSLIYMEVLELWGIYLCGARAETLMKRRFMPSTSPIGVQQSKLYLHWKEIKFPSQKITRKIHAETIATQALRILLSIYPLLKSKRLSVGAKLIIYKALIRSMLTYACPAWEFAVGSDYKTSVLRTIGNLPRHTLIRDLHRSFKIPYLHD